MLRFGEQRTRFRSRWAIIPQDAAPRLLEHRDPYREVRDAGRKTKWDEE